MGSLRRVMVEYMPKQECKKPKMAMTATSADVVPRAVVRKGSSKEFRRDGPSVARGSPANIVFDDACRRFPPQLPFDNEDLNSDNSYTDDSYTDDSWDDSFTDDSGVNGHVNFASPSNHLRGTQGGSLSKMGAHGKFSEGILHGKTEGKEKEMPASCNVSERVNHMSGGPHNNCAIPSFKGHIASQLWLGKERNVLECYSQVEKLKDLCEWSCTMGATVSSSVKASGLSHLVNCMFEHLDMPLLSAFVERWQPDTNTFHLPFGEMTIMLHDVFYILRIPVDGLMVDGYTNSDQLKDDMCRLLGISLDDLCAPSKPHWKGVGVSIGSIIERCRKSTRTPEAQSQGYLLALLGCTLFVNDSDDRFRPGPISLLKDMGQVCHYSWGAATLAFLYRQLGIASRIESVGICGCLSLLQGWIYEYFPTLRPKTFPSQPTEPRVLRWDDFSRYKYNDHSRLHMFREKLNRMEASQVNWLPYGRSPVVVVPRTTFTGNLCFQDVIEPYMPDRVLRQLGYIQVVPSPIVVPEKAERPGKPNKYTLEFSMGATKTMWRSWHFSHQLLLSKFQTSIPSYTRSRNYLHWYYRVSHPFVSRAPRSPWYMFQSVRVMERFIDKHSESCGSALDEIRDLVKEYNEQNYDQLFICTSATPFQEF